MKTENTNVEFVCQSSIICERSKAQTSTIKNLEIFKNLIETTKTAYLILDPNGRIKEFNKIFIDIIGNKDPNDLIEIKLSDLVPTSQKNKIEKDIARTSQNIPIEDLEICLDSPKISKNGTWIRINANMMENGERQILCLIQDVTNKKMEEFKYYINHQKHKDKIKQNISKIRDKVLNINKRINME